MGPFPAHAAARAGGVCKAFSLIRVYSCGPTPSPVARSWSAHGWPSRGEYTARRLSLTILPASRSARTCQATNASYTGLASVVIKDRRQSTPHPIAAMSRAARGGKWASQWAGSRNAEISASPSPDRRMISHCDAAVPALAVAFDFLPANLAGSRSAPADTAAASAASASTTAAPSAPSPSSGKTGGSPYAATSLASRSAHALMGMPVQ